MKRLAIVGAGPGGLTAAIAAAQAGLAPTVFEQAPDLGRVGGGIAIQSNGLRVLDALGLLAGFERLMQPARTVVIEEPGGRRRMTLDVGALPVPHARFAVVLRADLQEHLLAAARRAGVQIVLGRRCTRVVGRPGGAALEFADGTAHECDVVLGADGARSAVREASGLAARVTMVGLGSLRGVAERSTRGEVVREIWAAGGRRFGIAPLPHGRTYFYCSAPLGPWRDEVACDPRAWIDGWRSEIPEAAAILEAVADWSRVVYDELGEVVVRRWWRGPVVLLGDAAHAMTPDLGQGANSAMVDALVLVRLLAEAGARVEDAARAYERVRRRFVRRVQMAARQVCWLSSWSSAPGRALRRALLALNDASERVWPVGRRLAAGYNHAEERYFTAD